MGGRPLEFHRHAHLAQPVALNFTPAAGIVSTFAGRINNTGSVTQNGPGTTVFSDRATNKNSYTGGTTIAAGILQANSDNGLPNVELSHARQRHSAMLREQRHGHFQPPLGRERRRVSVDAQRRRLFRECGGDERERRKRRSP